MIKVFCDVCGVEINSGNKCSINNPHEFQCFPLNPDGDSFEIKIHINGKLSNGNDVCISCVKRLVAAINASKE